MNTKNLDKSLYDKDDFHVILIWKKVALYS